MECSGTKLSNSLIKFVCNQSIAKRYYHPSVGVGDYVKEYSGIYGKGLIIRLSNGREWFAPINEFTRII